MVKLLILMKDMFMNHRELVDIVSADIFKQTGRFESRRSWLAMRNYLDQLDDQQLRTILQESNRIPDKK